MHDVKSLFLAHFNSAPTTIDQAPGRLELLGNHTDYNEGLVLSMAVDKFTYIAASPRQDGQIVLVSSAFPEREQFPCDRIERNPKVPWANYVKGVLGQLCKRGANFSGFNAAIHGTIPIGAGMSSSAALEVATALAVRQLYPYRLTENGVTTPPRRNSKGELSPLDSDEKMRIAKLCQTAESEFVGVNCGLLDQISSLFGREGHVIEIDCRHITATLEPMPSGLGIVVCNSGVKHELAAGEYNALRQHCESAARSLGVRALRSVTQTELEAKKTRLDPRDYECAYHVIGEIQRVVFGERALREGDIEQFGQYLFQSHESSRDFFKNSCAELDVLVELARQHPGCIGARLTGGGFGGATINLVRDGQLQGFVEHIAAEYPKRTGRPFESWICRTVDGAR